MPTPWIASMIAVIFGVEMAIITRQGCVKCTETGAISRQLDLKIEARGHHAKATPIDTNASVEKIPLQSEQRMAGGKIIVSVILLY